MAMKGRKIINLIELWSIAGSGGLELWVSVISLWKSNICGPQQPPIERYWISVKNWNFDDPFHKKGLVLVIWVPGMIQPSGSVNDLMNWGCWGHWHCRDSKAKKNHYRGLKSHPGFSFILMFWKENNLCLNHEISCLILSPFLSEAVDASLCHFFGNWLMKLKFPILLNMLWAIIQCNHWSLYPS